jgi:hypothetical protein
MFRTEVVRVRREPKPQARPGPARPARPKAPKTEKLPKVIDGLARFEFFGPRKEFIGATLTGQSPTIRHSELVAAGIAGDEGLTDPAVLREAGQLLAVQPFKLAKDAYKPAEPPARGGEALYQRCIEAGYSLLLGANDSLAAIKPAGSRAWGDEAIGVAAPLIVGFMQGKPRSCQLPHDGTPPEAVTLAVGGCLVCAAHLGR